MDGNDQIRFCRECSRNVYNLSEMTHEQAQRIAEQREGRVCVRFYQRRDGTVLTSDCPVGQKRTFLRKSAGTALAVAGMAVGLTALPACGPVEDTPALMGDIEPRALMGKMLPNVDAGVPEPGETDEPDQPRMGEVALPEHRAIMGSIAVLHEAE